MKSRIIFLLILATLFVACSVPSQSEKPVIITSIVPLKSMIETIVGDDYEVLAIVPPGGNPTNYEPSPQEMEKLSNAKLYFTIQVPTELSNILPKINQFNPDIELIAVDEIIAEIYPFREFDSEHDDHDDHGSHDPHIWLSPKRMMVAAETITEKLIEYDSGRADYYKENGDHYIEELRLLDRYIIEKANQLSVKSFIIYHPSYGYFADDYGFEMIAIEEDGKEETAKGIATIIDYAVQHDIKVIFHQAEIDSQQAETIAKEIGGVTKMLTPLSEDYIGSMKEVIDTFYVTMKER